MTPRQVTIHDWSTGARTEIRSSPGPCWFRCQAVIERRRLASAAFSVGVLPQPEPSRDRRAARLGFPTESLTEPVERHFRNALDAKQSLNLTAAPNREPCRPEPRSALLAGPQGSPVPWGLPVHTAGTPEDRQTISAPPGAQHYVAVSPRGGYPKGLPRYADPTGAISARRGSFRVTGLASGAEADTCCCFTPAGRKQGVLTEKTS